MTLRGVGSRIQFVFRWTYREIQEAQLPTVASSLAYTTILSIIPLLAVSFAVFKTFGGLQKVYQTIEPIILDNLAEGASDEAIARIHSFIENAHTGTVGVTGFVGLIITCMLMLNSIETAFNRVWRCPNNRGLFQKISSYWLFITLGPLALSIALGMVTSSELPISSILPGNSGGFLISIGVFFGLYRFVPNTKVRSKYAFLASLLSASLWALARFGYQLYTSHFVSYNRLYGSLGAVPILLVWLYICWFIILGGAAFAAALQRQSGSNQAGRSNG